MDHPLKVASAGSIVAAFMFVVIGTPLMVFATTLAGLLTLVYPVFKREGLGLWMMLVVTLYVNVIFITQHAHVTSSGWHFFAGIWAAGFTAFAIVIWRKYQKAKREDKLVNLRD